MTDNAIDFDRADDEGLGEFVLPHLEDAPVNSDDQRERMDEQIIAALVSP